MKLEFPYKPGDEITIYADWENEKSPIGTAKLVSFHRQGRTFILEDMYPEDTQIVYNWQEWIIESKGLLKKRITIEENIIHKTDFNFISFDSTDGTVKYLKKIRYIDTIGIANSADDEEWEKEFDKLVKDSFLEVNGIQIY